MTPLATATTQPTARAAVVSATWTDVCAASDIVADTGACAFVGGQQVAIFRLRDGSIYAIDNIDPFTGAAVLSRGIVGDAGGIPKVASPIHKQKFDLRNGACLTDPSRSVRAFPVRVEGGRVQVGTDAGVTPTAGHP